MFIKILYSQVQYFTAVIPRHKRPCPENNGGGGGGGGRGGGRGGGGSGREVIMMMMMCHDPYLILYFLNKSGDQSGLERPPFLPQLRPLHPSIQY